MLGVLYLRLHALPEHVAYRIDKAQTQIVAILVLLAPLKHKHLYWIAGFLLAVTRLPNFSNLIHRRRSGKATGATCHALAKRNRASFRGAGASPSGCPRRGPPGADFSRWQARRGPNERTLLSHNDFSLMQGRSPARSRSCSATNVRFGSLRGYRRTLRLRRLAVPESEESIRPLSALCHTRKTVECR
jgi:hypothetical protein